MDTHNKIIREALQSVYRKHSMNDPSVSWNEMNHQVVDALCEIMGPNEFVEWRKQHRKKMNIGERQGDS